MQIPTPYYTLVNTSRDGDPAVVVLNAALRAFRQRGIFPWHLSIVISCQLLAERATHRAQENQSLYELEDEIARHLTLDENAIFLARVTCRSEREILFRVHDPEAAQDALGTLSGEPTSQRHWAYHMEHDPDWKLTQGTLGLLERDRQFN